MIRADGEDLATASGLAAPPLLLLVDPSRSVTATVLAGQLQRAYFTALPDLAVGRVADLIGTEFTEFTAAQQAEIAAGLQDLRASAGTSGPGGWTFDDLIERDNVAGQTAALNNVAYYAGAVAFMFLLFAAAQSALGILADQEAGILDRIAAGPGRHRRRHQRALPLHGPAGTGTDLPDLRRGLARVWRGRARQPWPVGNDQRLFSRAGCRARTAARHGLPDEGPGPGPADGGDPDHVRHWRQHGAPLLHAPMAAATRLDDPEHLGAGGLQRRILAQRASARSGADLLQPLRHRASPPWV